MNKKLKLFSPNFYNFLLIIGICISMVLTIGASLVISKIIDILEEPHATFQYVIKLVIILLALTIGSIVTTTLLSKYLPLSLQLNKAADTSVNMVKRLFKMPMMHYTEKQTGYFTNIIADSAHTYGEIYAMLNVELIANLICVIIVLIVSAYINPIFTIMYGVYIPILYLTIKRPSEKIYLLKKYGLSTRDEYYTIAKNVVKNKKSINVTRANDYFHREFEHYEHRYLSFTKKYKFMQIVTENIPVLLSSILQVVALGYTSYLFFNHKVEVGTIVFMFELSHIFQEPLTKCFEILIFAKINKPHLERLNDFIDKSEDTMEIDKHYGDCNYLFKIEKGEFFNNKYREDVLFAVNKVQVEKNTLTLIKGENGSGKSMVLDYLTGYANPKLYEGKIMINKEVRRAAYLTYPTLLTKGNIHDNLFDEEINQEVFEMLKINLKDKVIDHHHVNISFGEQQKVSLLRVLSLDREVIILDEPFTNLDQGTIDRLSKYIGKLKKNKSIIAITHSPELDKYADNLIEIKNKEMTIKKVERTSA